MVHVVLYIFVIKKKKGAASHLNLLWHSHVVSSLTNKEQKTYSLYFILLPDVSAFLCYQYWPQNGSVHGHATFKHHFQHNGLQFK